MSKKISTLLIKNHIQDLRNQYGLTQQELADKVGVTRMTIIALERGNYNPSLELAFRIAKCFCKTIDEIFFE